MPDNGGGIRAAPTLVSVEGIQLSERQKEKRRKEEEKRMTKEDDLREMGGGKDFRIIYNLSAA